MRVFLLALLQIYRWVFSPALHFLCGPGCGCRFEPECSLYAMEAIRKHGAWHGSALSLRRFLRCHPWGGCGYDPVPEPPAARACK